LHIAMDPNLTERLEIWLRRNENEAAKAKCKAEFTVAKVRQTHEMLDANTAQELHGIYENLIDFGAHPNQFGVMTSMKKKSESEKQINFSVGILYPEPLPVLFALRIAVGCAIGSLKTFQSRSKRSFQIICAKGQQSSPDRLTRAWSRRRKKRAAAHAQGRWAARENSSHDKKAIGNFNYRLLFGL